MDYTIDDVKLIASKMGFTKWELDFENDFYYSKSDNDVDLGALISYEADNKYILFETEHDEICYSWDYFVENVKNVSVTKILEISEK